MPDYNCKVVTAEGAVLERTVSADSMEALNAILKGQKEQLLSVKKAGILAFDLNKFLEQYKKVKPQEMKMFTNQLKVMLRAGIPILKCLDAIERQATTEKFRSVVKGLLKNVTGGASLSKAMGNFPEVFSTLYVSMIAAGESSGSLDKMLDQLEVFSEIDIKLKSNIKSALRYPMIVGGVMVIAGYIILTKVIPVFTQMFQSLGADLPITTKALIAMSGFLQEYGMITILSTAGTFFLVRTYIKTPGGAFQWDKLKLNLPVVKTVIRSGGMARFSLTLNTLVGSGVQIVDAFEITRKTIGNLVFEQEEINSGLQRIVAWWHFGNPHQIEFSGVNFNFRSKAKMEVFYSIRYTIPKVNEWLKMVGLSSIEHRFCNSGEEAVFLCQVL